MLALMVIIGNLQPFGQITPMGMKVLGVFVACIFGWITIDVLWISIFGFLAFSLTGYGSITQVIGAGLSNYTVILVLFSSLLAGVIESTNCVEIINKWLLTRNIIHQKPMALVFAIYLIGILGIFCNAGFAVVFLLWTLILNIADQCGYARKSPEVSFLLSMAVIVPLTSGNCIPYQMGVIAYSSFYDPTLMASFSYAKFMILGFSYLFVFCIAMTYLFKFIFKMDFSKMKLDEATIKEYENIKADSVQKFGLISVLIFTIVMLAPSFLPKTWKITQLINNLGLVGITIILFAFFAILRDENNQPITNFAKCHASVPWSVVWLLAFAMSLSDALKSPDTGIMATIMAYFGHAFNGMGIYTFMLIAALFVGILTQISNNMVLGALFFPIFSGVCVNLGGNPYIYFMLLLIVVNCAYATPAASLQGAMMHGHEAIGKKYAYSIGILAVFITIAICLVLYLSLIHI